MESTIADEAPVIMKDLVSSVPRHSRNTLYPKKRPQGVSKHKTPVLALKREPRSTRAAIQQAAQRSRDAQISALRAQGILLEEEYHNEIELYMHEMEVSTLVSPRFLLLPR